MFKINNKISNKSIFKILTLSFLLLSSSPIFSFGADEQLAQSRRGELKDFFDIDDPYQEVESSSEDAGRCKIRCRKLNPNASENNYYDKAIPIAEKYITKVVDFDASTGVTSCEVYPQNYQSSTQKLNIMANRKDIDCERDYKASILNIDESKLVSAKKINEKNDHLVNPNNLTYDRTKLTMSKFVAGLSTLDTDIIDLKQTIESGILERTDGQNIYTNRDNTYTDNETGKEVETGLVYNAMDKLSRENLGYYADLAYNMDQLYDYMVSYLFVFIALFFMIKYFSAVAIKKIAKKPTTYDESWQQKLAVVVVACIVFFIPVRDSSIVNPQNPEQVYSATFFQNSWKFFVDESNSIADRANWIGMQVLMRNTYNTTGAAGVQTEKNLAEQRAQQEFLKKSYDKAIYDFCEKQFPGEMTFQNTFRSEIRGIEELKEAEETDFVYQGCRAVEKRYKEANTAFMQYDYMLNRIQAVYGTTGENGKPIIVNRLKAIDEFMMRKVEELGWFAVALAPTLKLQVQGAYMQSNEQSKENGGKDIPQALDQTVEATINAATTTEIAKREWTIEGGNQFSNQFNANETFQREVGETLGAFAYTMLPGYSSTKKFIEGLGDNAVSQLLASIPIIGDLFKSNTIKEANIDKAKLTIFLQKYWLMILPLIAGFISCSIKIIMYLFELIIFTFVSPFIVAYALTTGQPLKIMEFLVRGVVIFLQPTIIVISVYLALFLYSLFGDVFLAMADEQYSMSILASDSFFGDFSFYAIKYLTQVFASIASAILIWKIIIDMPDFVFKLVGLDKHISGSLGSSMQSYLSKYGFKA